VVRTGAVNAVRCLAVAPILRTFDLMEQNLKTLKDPKKLLFVCLGNICRSPAAEGVMREMVRAAGLSERVVCDSAGTYGGHAGELPDERMRRAAAARGLSLTHRARQLKAEDFDRFDLIITMDDRNYERAHRTAPTVEAAAKIHRMTSFCRSHPDATHVPDPYYEGAEGFEKVLDLLEDACGGLLEEIKEGRV